MEKRVCLWCYKTFLGEPINGICTNCGYNKFLVYDTAIIGPYHDGVIIKIGGKDTLNSMRKGNLWFQSPKYYQNYAKNTGNTAIGDVNECAYDYVFEIPLSKAVQEALKKSGDQNFYIDGMKAEILEHICKNGKVTVRIYSDTQNYNRLLCFYLLSSCGYGDDNAKFVERDEKLRKFGDYFCIVNTNILTEILEKHPQLKNMFFSPTDVKYVGDKYCGEYDPVLKKFNKPYAGIYNPTFKSKEYEYQHEFRYILRDKSLNEMDEEEPLKIHVDGMENVMSKPYSIDKLFELKRLKEIYPLWENK